MRICTVEIQGTAPYAQSRMHETPREADETHDDWERRTWREKCTTDAEGRIVVPGMALKQAVDYAAGLLAIQIPGKGKATYTKAIGSGVMVLEDLCLGIAKAEVGAVRIYAHANGSRGSGRRVWRWFPTVPAPWGGSVEFALVDDSIPKDVFERIVVAAGRVAGVGQFRPQNKGTNGRFSVESFVWSEV